MTKAVLERVDVEIKRRRSEVSRLHAELEDLDDYLDVLAARQRAAGKRTYKQAEIEKRYRTK
jgi:Skp family chaperone for outer membrane proteins